MLAFPLVYKVTFPRLQCNIWLSDGCLMLFDVWRLQFLLSDYKDCLMKGYTGVGDGYRHTHPLSNIHLLYCIFSSHAHILALFTVPFVYDQSELKNKPQKKKISTVCETLSKVFEEHEAPNKL